MCGFKYNVLSRCFWKYGFIIYLDATRKTPGHWRGRSLIHSLLITVLLTNLYEGHQEPGNEVNSQNSAEVFLGKGIMKICRKFTGEHPSRSAISIKLTCNFIEVALQHECSPVNLPHIFKKPFPKDTSGWLLLTQPSASVGFSIEIYFFWEPTGGCSNFLQWLHKNHEFMI